MSDIISTEILTELADQVGVELIDTLLDDLAEDAGGRVARMQDLLGPGQEDELRKEAHTLKSSSGTLGLAKLSEQAAIIERKIVTGEGPDYTPIVPQLPALLEEGLTSVRNWVQAQ